jgi:phosphatidate phosphatase PAH1
MRFLSILIFFTGANLAFTEEIAINKIDWNHLTNKLFSNFKDYHFAPDVLAAENQSAVLQARFSYSFLGKSLKDERVEIFLENSNKVQKIAEVNTDEAGIINFNWPSALMPKKGVYKVYLRVLADSTFIVSNLIVLEPGAKIAIFDLDGTLTAGFCEMAFEVLDYLACSAEYSARRREGAVELTKYWSEKMGAYPVYLTGRHYMISKFSNSWLKKHQFSLGAHIYPLYTHLALRGDSSNGAFKLSQLKYLHSLGFNIVAAYGDELSDLNAFYNAGISDEKIYMLNLFNSTRQYNIIEQNLLEHIQKLQQFVN